VFDLSETYFGREPRRDSVETEGVRDGSKRGLVKIESKQNTVTALSRFWFDPKRGAASLLADVLTDNSNLDDPQDWRELTPLLVRLNCLRAFRLSR
jgi:hypothetical protein